jgi:signal transduction histidine kinase/ActR/RegA family two-component response regulator
VINPENIQQNKNLVVIAEDSITQAKRLGFILSTEGYQVLHGKNGKIALDLVMDNVPGLVISDIVMPEMDGFELSRRIKENSETSHISVILLTTLNDVEDIFKGLSCGADSFINKPYSEDYLLRHINDVIETTRIKGEKFAGLDLEIFLHGQKHHVNTNPAKMLSLLVSTYESAVFKNKELNAAHRKLNDLNLMLEEKVIERTRELREEIRLNIEKTNELEKKNRELEQFAYITSHDLQEPLLTIVGFTDLLLKESTSFSPEQQLFTTHIHSAASRMSNQIKGLLTYTRIGRNKNQETVDCNKVIEDLKTELALRIEQTGTRISYSELPVVNVFYEEFKSLLQNLICNAIRFSKENEPPKIEIYAENHNDFYKFVVKDFGIGIPKKHHEKIFQMFQRLHGRDKYDGNGIGLALCKKIVEMHGGDIWVESEPEEYSSFNFTLKKY